MEGVIENNSHHERTKQKIQNMVDMVVGVCLIAWSQSGAPYDTELLVKNINPKVSVDNVLFIYMTGSLRIPTSSVLFVT